MLEAWLFQHRRYFGAVLRVCLMYIGCGIRSLFIVSGQVFWRNFGVVFEVCWRLADAEVFASEV